MKIYHPILFGNFINKLYKQMHVENIFCQKEIHFPSNSPCPPCARVFPELNVTKMH